MRLGNCVGCQEADSVVRVDGLGGVCESCAEVVDVVFEVETERVLEATAEVRALLEVWRHE